MGAPIRSERVRHGDGCSMSFGRPSPLGDCARCDELRGGAPAREGWNARRKSEARAIAREVARHSCARRGCGPVCTFGDW